MEAWAVYCSEYVRFEWIQEIERIWGSLERRMFRINFWNYFKLWEIDWPLITVPNLPRFNTMLPQKLFLRCIIIHIIFYAVKCKKFLIIFIWNVFNSILLRIIFTHFAWYFLSYTRSNFVIVSNTCTIK